MRFPTFSSFVAIFSLLLTLSFSPTSAFADAQEIKIGTFIPKGSSWDRVLRAWAGSLKKKSNGDLTLRFVRVKHERALVSKLKKGKIDGAILSAQGLESVVPASLVLSAPGLIRSYETMSHVQHELDSELRHVFDSAGYPLVGWLNFGQARIFSTKALSSPKDFATTKLWLPKRNQTLKTVYKNAGGKQGIVKSLDDVETALASGEVDTVAGSAIAALSLQWLTHITHVSSESEGIIIGATLLSTAGAQKLNATQKDLFDKVATKALKALKKRIRKDDDKAYEAALARGIKRVPMQKHDAAWKKVAAKSRKSLAGKLYPKKLETKVSKLAH